MLDPVVIGIVGLDSEGRVTSYVPVVFSEAELGRAREDCKNFNSVMEEASSLVTREIGFI